MTEIHCLAFAPRISLKNGILRYGTTIFSTTEQIKCTPMNVKWRVQCPHFSEFLSFPHHVTMSTSGRGCMGYTHSPTNKNNWSLNNHNHHKQSSTKFLNCVIWTGWLWHTKAWLKAKRRSMKKVRGTLCHCSSPASGLYISGHLSRVTGKS